MKQTRGGCDDKLGVKGTDGFVRSTTRNGLPFNAVNRQSIGRFKVFFPQENKGGPAVLVTNMETGGQKRGDEENIGRN